MKRRQNVNAVISGLVALCVLCTLFFDATASDSALRVGKQREKGAAAMRYLPVYSYLGTAETNESYLMDTTHGGEGYIAVTAKSEEPVRVKLIAPSGTERIYNVPNTGLVAYYPLSDGNGRYGIQLLRRVENGASDNLYERVLEGACEASLFDEFQPFLRPSTYVWFTGYSDCVNAAATLCTGQSNDDRKIERIKSFICEKLVYDESLAQSEGQSFIRDPDAILGRGTGTCLDYAVLAAAMLRSQGIPTKVVYGSLNQTEDNFHAWNMVYTSSRGWFRIDIPSTDNGLVDSFITDDANYTDTGWY
jgi:transglutaminase-like putative cysteine protease